MSKQVQDAYIVAATRTPVGKAPRGVFRNTRPDEMLAHSLRAVLAQAPGVDAGEIAVRIATVLCGGEVDRGSLVDEAWLLRLEREHFVALAQMPKTQERIAHMLKTGKPLRN